MEHTEWVDVTPAIAQRMLKHNTRNPRAFNQGWANHLLGVMQRGEYVSTHQGVGIYEDGAVCDGQHRLWAISQMPNGFSLRMPITTGLRDEAGDGVDVGKKRSHADILGADSRDVECARVFAKLHYSERASSLTVADVRPFLALVQRPHQELLAFKPGAVKLWTAAPFRAAAVFNMLRGRDKDYIKVTYAALAESDYDLMSPSARALYKSHMAGSVRAAAWMETFAKAVKVYDIDNANLKQIKSHDQQKIVSDARVLIARMVGLQKKAPALAEAKCLKAPTNSNGWVTAA
jgi:hypothetical protein